MNVVNNDINDACHRLNIHLRGLKCCCFVGLNVIVIQISNVLIIMCTQLLFETRS